MKQPTVCHLFCGAGGGALGFQRAGFRSVGNFDLDAQACRDVEYLTGERAHVADLGAMSPQELAEKCGERPDVVFTSPPCKGYSGCLAGERSQSPEYQGLNSLAFRGVWLALEAWETPPPLILLENVPRIQSRGKHWLRELEALLHAYGYAVTMGGHDCGELAGLAQHRRRFLLVARHMEQVPEYLRVPPKKRVKALGEVLSQLPVPLPGSEEGGPMHRLPRMIPMNWLRLALITAGKDWRDLPEAVELSKRSARQNGGFGVNRWDRGAHAVVAEGTVRNTWASVADPRLGCAPRSGVYGVLDWEQAMGAVIGKARVDNGSYAVADPRLADGDGVDLTAARPCHLLLKAPDGTWHRPLTTLELAAVQGFPTRHRGEWLKLAGNSHKRWREAIGNAVPPPAAEAIARNCAATLGAAADGTFSLSSEAIWVEPEDSTPAEADRAAA